LQVVEQTHSFVFALIDYETQGFLVDNEVDSDIFVDATAEEFAGVFGDEETPATFLDIPFEEGNAMRILRDRGDSWYVVQLADSGLVGIVSSAAVSSPTETQVDVTIWTDVEETVDVQVEVEVSSGSSSDSSEYLSDDDAVDSVAVGKVTQEGHPEVASGGESVDEGDEPLSVLEKMMDRMRTPHPNLLSHETASYGTLHRMRSASVSKSSTTDTQPMRLVIKEGFIVKKGAKRRNWNKRYCKLTVSQFQKLGGELWIVGRDGSHRASYSLKNLELLFVRKSTISLSLFLHSATRGTMMLSSACRCSVFVCASPVLYLC
jgi:hypothetical protein